LPIGITLDFASSPPACPVFAGRLVRGVKNGESPDWLKKRLAAIGLRPISALVDITNYIANDRARPLHVYDADKLKGPIGARMGRRGERFRALDGRDYAVDDTMCVIADENGVLGLGGVIGGEASGATASTVNVFIESALFEPAIIAATGRKLGIESEARYRFERGVDPDFVVPGLELATRMILELCGGEPSEIVVAGKVPEARSRIDFDPGLVARLGGLSLEAERAGAILSALGFGVQRKGASFIVSPPSWRADIHGPADLVEEIVRIAGLASIPSAPLPRDARVAPPVLTARQRQVGIAKRALAARGLVEAVTYSFVNAEHASMFSGGNAPPIKLANPISSELGAMRPSGLPALVLAAQRNVNRGLSDCALFEVGPVFEGAEPGAQAMVAAGVRRGKAQPRHWRLGARAVDPFDVKADVMAVLDALGVSGEAVETEASSAAWYHPGQSGIVRLGPKTVLAQFGMLHPAVLDKMDAKGPLAGFEVFLDALPKPKARASRARASFEASPFMPLERDFAFVVDEAVEAQDILRAARRADKALIADVSVFDVFADPSLGTGKKSVAIAVTIQPRERTLTDEEIEVLSQRIVDSVIRETKGTLRT
jgi:phenylalanyl-tRNA synthetase beta chain